MKYVLFILWLILTVALALSIVGFAVLLRSNNTNYYKTEEENRSFWMKVGYELLTSILKK